MGFLDKAGLERLWGKVEAALSGKQDKLTGTAGQVVGFNEVGKAIPVPLATNEWKRYMGHGSTITFGFTRACPILVSCEGWDYGSMNDYSSSAVAFLQYNPDQVIRLTTRGSGDIYGEVYVNTGEKKCTITLEERNNIYSVNLIYVTLLE